MDHNAQGRRPHYHRGRRGPDRRGSERRAPQQEQGARSPAEQVDVEQIMRDIRSRIAQRHGIELSTPQIQELAARRLEAILDPRGVNPALMEQLRRSAAAPAEVAPATPDPGYTFEDTTLFETHRGVLRFIRRLLNPILKLFLNPNPLVHALHTQSRLNREAAAREIERERQQAEWNALHYEVLQRMVMEVSRVSIEMQSLAARIESLSTKVDFNDRKVRSLENTSVTNRPSRSVEQPPAPPAAASGESVATEPAPAAEGGQGDGSRRRRRRRRGRRSGAPGADAGADAAAAAGAGLAAEGAADGIEGDDSEEDEPVNMAIETGAVGAGAMENGGIESGAVENRAAETSSVETSAVETSAVETSAVETSAIDASATEAGVPPQRAADAPMMADTWQQQLQPPLPETSAEAVAAPASEPSVAATPAPQLEQPMDDRRDVSPPPAQALTTLPGASQSAPPQPAPPPDEPAPQVPTDTADPGPPDR